MGIFPSRAKSRRACFGISVLGVWDDLRGARQLGAEHRATYLYSVDPRDLDHDAVMRIGGRAPERWAHSTRRPESHSWVRVTTTSDRHRMPATFSVPRLRRRCLARRLQAGRISTPTSVSPVVTKRHNSIISLRAMATISDLRAPCRASVVRERYHCASALSF
jgi:hypothetical protein